MPSNSFDLPSTGNFPSSEVEALQKLRRLIDKKNNQLRAIRDKDGIEAADAAQLVILEEFPRSEYKMYDEIFDQGRLRGLFATNTIIETRGSLNKLTDPLLTKEQEIEQERMDDLRHMLEQLLKKIDELKSCGPKMAVSKKFSDDLMKQVKSYSDLAQSSAEAKDLVQEIIENIGELARLINESHDENQHMIN